MLPLLRYGVTDALSANMMLWSSIYETGLSPSIHLQLVDRKQKLNLGLKGNISTELYDCLNGGDESYNKHIAINFWGVPELSWELVDFFLSELVMNTVLNMFVPRVYPAMAGNI